MPDPPVLRPRPMSRLRLNPHRGSGRLACRLPRSCLVCRCPCCASPPRRVADQPRASRRHLIQQLGVDYRERLPVARPDCGARVRVPWPARRRCRSPVDGHRRGVPGKPPPELEARAFSHSGSIPDLAAARSGRRAGTSRLADELGVGALCCTSGAAAAYAATSKLVAVTRRQTRRPAARLRRRPRWPRLTRSSRPTPRTGLTP